MKWSISLTLAVSAIIAAMVAVSFLTADEKPPKEIVKPKETAMEVLKETPEPPKTSVVKTDEEWKKTLTPEQYRILREAGTERADGEVYKEFKEQGAGTYYCAGCNAELFTSNEKFDSHCGWPSFYDPAKAKNVKFNVDFHLGYARTEVLCKICNGHLGHVFEGEGFDTPTDKRYCINGTVLKFVPADASDTQEKTEAKDSTKPKAE